MSTLDEVLACLPAARQDAVTRRAADIIAGLNDAIAWAKGDESAARIIHVHTPEPENAEDRAVQAKAKAGLNTTDRD